MPTRNVVLTKHQEKVIKTLVDSGRYQNASEVLREGLRLVEQREARDAAKLKVLRRAARIGFGALDRGEFKECNSAADIRAYLNELSEKVVSRAAEYHCMPGRKRRVRLSAAAQLDLAIILKWTAENFGAAQSGIYRGQTRLSPPAGPGARRAWHLSESSRRRDRVGDMHRLCRNEPACTQLD